MGEAVGPEAKEDTKCSDSAGTCGATTTVTPCEGRITTAYYTVNKLSWVWQPTLPKWQRGAVAALLHPEPLTADDHPLHQPGKEGIPLYNVTDKDGIQKLCFSLAQLEYLIYYIHDMRLADPVMVDYLSKVDASKERGGTGEEVEQPGPPQYPEGEEVIVLPDDFITEGRIRNVEEVFFTSGPELKRALKRQKKLNKSASVVKYVPTTSQMVTLEYETVNLVDGTPPHSESRTGPEDDHPPRGWAADGEGGVIPRQSAESNAAEEAVRGTPDVSALALDDGSSEESPSPFCPPTNFATDYYDDARRSLFYATGGGKAEVDLILHSAGLLKLVEPSHPSIGRSLFMSIHITTWEADEQTVLEVGWSAIWWEQRDAYLPSEQYEEMRDVGHIMVEDHLADKQNRRWKLDHRPYFRYGESQPVKWGQVERTLQDTIKDLSTRAGGGPIYIIIHSADAPIAGLDAVGCDTQHWLTQFKQPTWSGASYQVEEALGKTFIIDTTILTAAAEHDPADGPAPVKTDLSLEQVSWILFGDEENEIRHPLFCGNAGNDAFYNLEVFLSLVTAPSLHELRPMFSYELDEAEDSSDLSRDDDPEEADLAIQSEQVGSADDGPTPAEDDSDDEDLIKGVYITDEDGQEIVLE